MAPQCFSDLAVLGGGASEGGGAPCIVGGGLGGSGGAGGGWYQQEVGSVLLRPKAEPEDDLGYERAMSGVIGSAEVSSVLSELPVISSVMSVGGGRSIESSVVGESSVGESVDLKGSHGGAGLSTDALSSPCRRLLDNDDGGKEATSRGVAMETSPPSDHPRIGKREEEEEEEDDEVEELQQQQQEEEVEGRRERFSPYEGDGKMASEGGRPETSDAAANVSRGRPEALGSPNGNGGNGGNGGNAGRGDGDDTGGGGGGDGNDVMVVDSSPSASAASTLLSLAVAHPHPPLPPLTATPASARTSGQNGTGGGTGGRGGSGRNPTLSQSVPPLTPNNALPQRRGMSGFRDGHLRNVAPFNHHHQNQQQHHQHRQQPQPRNDKIIAAIMSRVRAQRHRDHPGLAFSRDSRRFAANFSASPSSSSSAGTAASAQLSVAPLASVGSASSAVAGGGPPGAPAPDGETPSFSGVAAPPPPSSSSAAQRHAAAATLEFARREHVARMENLRLEREILEMKRDVWRLRRQSLQAGVEVYPLEGDDCDGL
uniref:PE-PGRS family protein PE_PGRS16-like n=1 Tax=Petromyzon marinus TaxID=7757 RepID=A0AAJ7UHG7_PETMA|nr:PE-PGRS family protein PE_PGRS16-like [Petromyzon marinus]